MNIKYTSFFIAGFLFPMMAMAQVHQVRTDKDVMCHVYNLNPVVVTGSGHHQRLKSTVTPVRVLSKQEIKEQGISTFSDVLIKMMPQASMSPGAMGSFLRLNGLGNKYILILVNGKKMTGDIGNNVDLNRINMATVKRIEILDGAASSLYGSDAIGGVINIITDQPVDEMVALVSDTRVSGKGQITQSINLDAFSQGFGSYTSFSHDHADSYQNNDQVYLKGSTEETQRTLAPLFTGYTSNLFSQRFIYSPNYNFALHAEASVSYKRTDRPDTQADVIGGSDYEMRYKSLRWNVGGIYRFNSRNSIQIDFLTDKYRYGKEYDVSTETNKINDYIQSKKQKSYDTEIKGIFGLIDNGTTIVGADWRNDFLWSSSGSVDRHVYTIAGYAQHEQKLFDRLTATAGVRYTYHGAFGSNFTPKVALMYSLGDVNLRATYSNGFRAPGLDELYYHYFSVNKGKAQISFGNKDLDPEKSHYVSFSAGYHTHRFMIGVMGYLNFINSMIVKKNIAVTPENLSVLREEFPELTDAQASMLEKYAFYTNSDKGEVKGVQVNASLNLFDGFNLSAHYVYTYGRSHIADKWGVLDRSIKNTVVVAANYHHHWGKYALNINLNGRLQGKTYYSAYEDAPGHGVWNLHSSHIFDSCHWAIIEPNIGIDNIFDRVDRRIDSAQRRYALYSPGRMLVVGLRVKLK